MNSAQLPPSSSAFWAKPARLSTTPSRTWLRLALNTCGAKWDKHPKPMPTVYCCANLGADWGWLPHAQTPACAYASWAPYSAAATTPNTTGRPEKKPASAKLNGTTTTAMALEAMQNTITGSSTVSKRYSTRPTTWSHYYSIIYTGTSTKYSKLNI